MRLARRLSLVVLLLIYVLILVYSFFYLWDGLWYVLLRGGGVVVGKICYGLGSVWLGKKYYYFFAFCLGVAHE